MSKNEKFRLGHSGTGNYPGSLLDSEAIGNLLGESSVVEGEDKKIDFVAKVKIGDQELTGESTEFNEFTQSVKEQLPGKDFKI